MGGGRTRPRWAQLADFDGQFMYCRGAFSGNWTTDYPGADNNFSIRLAELTRIQVKFDEDRQPHHIVVRLDDPLMYRCPMVFMENPGSMELGDDEVARLRDYLMRGGFISEAASAAGTRVPARWRASACGKRSSPGGRRTIHRVREVPSR